jgi:hypothetical protein
MKPESYPICVKENALHESGVYLTKIGTRSNLALEEFPIIKKNKKTNMGIYNLMEPNFLLELLMLVETCGTENSVYISMKNLSTMSR